MPFFTRPHFEDRQIVQYSGESMTLSGQTHYSNTGQAIVNSTILYEEPEFPLTGATSGQTTITLVGLTGYMYESNFRSNGGGLIIKPPILKLSGSTGYTTTDVTGYVLKALDSGGTITWAPISVSADTNTFVTGGTLNGTNLDLTWNTGGSVPSIDLSPLSASTNFANTDLTLTGDRVHDLSGYTVTLKDEKDDQTRLIVENLFNGGSANSAVSVRSRGAGGVTISGTILYGGDSFNGYGSFTDGGSGLLTNAFSMTSLGGTPSQRGNINIGSRRGTDAEVRIFNGGDDFDFTSLGAKFTTTGFTSYQDVYIDNLPSESVLGTDANGKIIAGTGGGTFTGNTSASCITDLYVSNVYGCSPITIHDTITYDGSIIDSATTNSFIFGDSHVFTASTGTHGVNFDANVLLGGNTNKITPFQIGRYNTIIGGNTNEIGGVSRVENNIILGSTNSSIINSYVSTGGSSMLGGDNNNILGGDNSAIIGGQNNTILSGVQKAVILGGQNITGSTSDTVYVPNLIVRNDHILHSDSVLEVEDLPSTFEDELKGQVTYFNWSGLTTHTTSNDNPEGRVGFLMGNFSNFPTTKTYGFLTYYNSGYTRTGTPPVGADFYRDKLVLKAADGANGLIINPQASNPSGNLWFELDGSSVMKLKGDGTGKAKLGIAMNPDGTEDATANLQIGGTGTTGTIKLVDGNQQAGYVLTSDADGNASWAASAGGGGVTIDPYQDEGNVTSITWDVSGTSTNYEATLTGATTLTMSNVRNGDYGTLIVTQDGTGSRTLSFAGGTHKVVNGGGGAPTLTTTAGATDILSFTYNGTNFYWTVGNDYT